MLESMYTSYLLFKRQRSISIFMHFEKIASSLKWPEDVWTVLLQSVFVGKAHEIYSALPVEQSSQYQLVKEAVLFKSLGVGARGSLTKFSQQCQGG